jgi:hypothetical protein
MNGTSNRPKERAKNLDDFDHCVIKRTIHGLYSIRPIIRKPHIICAVILVNPCFIHVHDIIPCFPKKSDLSQISEGLIDGCDLVFLAKSKDGDYHQVMNSVVFLEWFKNQLMPALKNPSLVVLDNVSYHNVKTEDTVCPNFF